MNREQGFDFIFLTPTAKSFETPLSSVFETESGSNFTNRWILQNSVCVDMWCLVQLLLINTANYTGIYCLKLILNKLEYSSQDLVSPTSHTRIKLRIHGSECNRLHHSVTDERSQNLSNSSGKKITQAAHFKAKNTNLKSYLVVNANF